MAYVNVSLPECNYGLSDREKAHIEKKKLEIELEYVHTLLRSERDKLHNIVEAIDELGKVEIHCPYSPNHENRVLVLVEKK